MAIRFDRRLERNLRDHLQKSPEKYGGWKRERGAESCVKGSSANSDVSHGGGAGRLENYGTTVINRKQWTCASTRIYMRTRLIVHPENIMRFRKPVQISIPEPDLPVEPPPPRRRQMTHSSAPRSQVNIKHNQKSTRAHSGLGVQDQANNQPRRR